MEVQFQIINNKNIFAFKSKDEFLKYIDQKNKILIALNAEKLNTKNQDLDKLINHNIGYPDGIGAVLALRRKGIKAIKIPGAEFWLDIIRRYHRSKSFYLIGSTQEVMDATVKNLKADFPQIQLAGYRNGYFKKEDHKKIISDLQLKKADVVFVAMGSPKQEFLMEKFKESHPALYMGLGGSFDVYSG